MNYEIYDYFFLDLTAGGGTAVQSRVFATFADMLAANPQMNAGDKAIVNKDPDGTLNGRYTALKTPSVLPVDFLKAKEPFEIRPWKAATAFHEGEMVVDSKNHIYYVTADFTSKGNIDLDIKSGDLAAVGSEGLRGVPIADEQALKALPARDFELRAVKSTGKQYVFEKDATKGDIQAGNGPGYWIEVKNGGQDVYTVDDTKSILPEGLVPGNILIVKDNDADRTTFLDIRTDVGIVKGDTVEDYLNTVVYGVDYKIKKIDPTHIQISVRNVSKLQEDLDNKSDIGHLHSPNQVKGLDKLLDAKADKHHKHEMGEVHGLTGELRDIITMLGLKVNSIPFTGDNEIDRIDRTLYVNEEKYQKMQHQPNTLYITPDNIYYVDRLITQHNIDEQKKVHIRFWSNDPEAMKNANIIAKGGSARLDDKGDGSWDLISKDPLPFVALQHNNNNFMANRNLGVYKIQVLVGDTLRETNDGSSALVAGHAVEEFEWRGLSSLKTTEGMFDNCVGLRNLIIGEMDTDKVRSMKNMFKDCKSLGSVDLSRLISDKVTTMEGMFKGCRSLSKIDTHWLDTSNVVRFDEMFSACASLENIDIHKLDIHRSDSIHAMFSECVNLVNVSLPNTRYPIDMSDLFRNCTKLVCLNALDTTLAIDRANMFAGCDNLHHPDKTERSQLVSSSGLDWKNDKSCKIYFQAIVESPTRPEFDVTSGSVNVLDLGNGTWEVTSDNEISHIAVKDSSKDITKIEFIDTLSLTSVSGMFKNCTDLNQVTFTEDSLNKCEDFSEMFFGCTSLPNVDVSNVSWKNAKTLHSMFNRCAALNDIVFSGMEFPKLESTEAMFYGVKGGKITFNPASTPVLTNTRYMFAECDALTDLGFTLNTANCDKMDSMFKNIGISNMDMTSLTFSPGVDVSNLFEGSRQIVQIALPDTSKCAKMDGMFLSCPKLKCINQISTESASSSSTMFDGSDAIVNPNARERSLLEAGRYKYTKSSPCVLDEDTVYIKFYTEPGKGIYIKGDGDIIDTNGHDYKIVRSKGLINWVKLDVLGSRWAIHKVEFVKTDGLLSMDDFFGKDSSDLLNGLKEVVFHEEKAFRAVTSFEQSFSGLPNDTIAMNLEKVDPFSATTMENMFLGTHGIKKFDIAYWKTDVLEKVNNMFGQNNGVKTLDLSRWNLKSITNMRGWFWEAAVERIAFPKLDMFPAGWCNQNGVFLNASNLTCINRFSTVHGNDTTSMFDGTTSLINPDAYGKAALLVRGEWNNNSACEAKTFSALIHSSSIPEVKAYDPTTAVEVNVNVAEVQNGVWEAYTEDPINKISVLELADITEINIVIGSNIESLNDSFSSLVNLEKITFPKAGSGREIANLNDLGRAFKFCGKLQSIDLSDVDLTGITTMFETFADCASLENAKFGTLNSAFSKCSNFYAMFYGCEKLICVDYLDTTMTAADKSNMFFNSTPAQPDASTITKLLSANGLKWTRTRDCSIKDVVNNGKGIVNHGNAITN